MVQSRDGREALGDGMGRMGPGVPWAVAGAWWAREGGPPREGQLGNPRGGRPAWRAARGDPWEAHEGERKQSRRGGAERGARQGRAGEVRGTGTENRSFTVFLWLCR